MFGYSAFAQTPFATIPMLGTPASVTLTGQELFIYVNNVATTADANVNLVSQLPLVASQGVLRFNSAYALNGQQITSFIENLDVTAHANTTLDSQLLQVFQNTVNGVAGYIITGIGMTADQGSLSTTADSNVVLNGEALAGLTGTITATGTGSTTLLGQLANISQGTVGAAANAVATITGITALININNVLVWGVIPTPDDPAWQTINTQQAEGWVVIPTDQNSIWGNIQTANTTWTDIDDSQPGDGDWTNIPN